MPKLKEGPELKSENFYAVSTLDPETKMKMILEIFDLGEDKEQNKKRRAAFIKLMGKHNEQSIKHRPSTTPNHNITSSEITDIHSSDENKKKLHDQIIEILRNMSLSLGLNKDQRLLAEYLVRNRGEVERLIRYYFTGKDPVKVTTHSEYLKTKEHLDFLNNKTEPEEE